MVSWLNIQTLTCDKYLFCFPVIIKTHTPNIHRELNIRQKEKKKMELCLGHNVQEAGMTTNITKRKCSPPIKTGTLLVPDKLTGHFNNMQLGGCQEVPLGQE